MKQNNHSIITIILWICYKVCKEKKAEETHRINEQKDADCLNFINNTRIKKNEQYNLVPLCKECHNKQTMW